MTTWLTGLPDQGTEWSNVAALAPAAFDELVSLSRASWDAVDPVALELCRLRMAAMLRFESGTRVRHRTALSAGLVEDKVARLPSWPTDPAFGPTERACLAFAEQYVADVHGVTDELVDEMLATMSAAECYTFVRALWAVEALQRLCLVLGIEPDADELDLVPPAQAEP